MKNNRYFLSFLMIYFGSLHSGSNESRPIDEDVFGQVSPKYSPMRISSHEKKELGSTKTISKDNRKILHQRLLKKIAREKLEQQVNENNEKK